MGGGVCGAGGRLGGGEEIEGCEGEDVDRVDGNEARGDVAESGSRVSGIAWNIVEDAGACELGDRRIRELSGVEVSAQCAVCGPATGDGVDGGGIDRPVDRRAGEVCRSRRSPQRRNKAVDFSVTYFLLCCDARTFALIHPCLFPYLGHPISIPATASPVVVPDSSPLRRRFP